MKYLSLVLSILLFTACSSTGPASKGSKNGSVLLRMTNPSDGPFRYSMSTNQDISSMAMGQTTKQKVEQTVEYTYLVEKEHADGNMDVKVTMDEFIVNQSGFENVEYNSKEDENPSSLVGKLYASALGSELNLTLSPSGAVSALTGGDAIIDKMFEADMGLTPDQVESMKVSMSMQFGDATMQETMNQISNFIPEKAIKVGDTWSKNYEQSTNMKLGVNNNFTVEKIEAGKVYLKVVGTLATGEDSEALDMGAMSVEYDLTGTQNGQIVIDQTTGWIINSMIDQKIAGTMTIEMDQMPAPFDAMMEADTKLIFKRLD